MNGHSVNVNPKIFRKLHLLLYCYILVHIQIYEFNIHIDSLTKRIN